MFALLLFTLLDAESLPVVCEHYDAIIIHQDGEYSIGRAYFIRDSKIIADRSVDGEWDFGTDGERIELRWCEFGMCRRRVACDVLIWSRVAPIKPDEGNQQWWNAARVMTDLRAPERLK